MIEKTYILFLNILKKNQQQKKKENILKNSAL